MSTLLMPRNALEKHAIQLQYLTLGWMVIECSFALTAAWRAKSVSLLAFGSDSFVEFLSALVVLLQFSPALRISQTRAVRVCGTLLYVLAGFVCCITLASFAYGWDSDTSGLGIAITAGALVLMPILARSKRNAAERLGNKAMRADAVQSATCAYLAAITLSGLLLHFFVHFN